MAFVGPTEETLRVCGDKVASVRLAKQLSIPTLDVCSLPNDFRIDDYQNLPFPVILKAPAGGGGLGHRVAMMVNDLLEASKRCRSEGGVGASEELLVERFVSGARHIEVQIIGDGRRVVHLGTRDCSVQTRFAKFIEMAPAQRLSDSLRERLHCAAVEYGKALRYRGIGTVEFLVLDTEEYFFLEVNPRLQVEHTVTEEVYGVDLVSIQLRIALGETLDQLHLWPQQDLSTISSLAVQFRVNTLSYPARGAVVTNMEFPTGGNVRIETAHFVGAPVSLEFDALLALVVFKLTRAADIQHLSRRLKEINLVVSDGAITNLALLQRVAADGAFRSFKWKTDTVDTDKMRESALLKVPNISGSSAVIYSPVGGVLRIELPVGSRVIVGSVVAIVTSLKMEHEVRSSKNGVISAYLRATGDHVSVGDVLAEMEEGIANSADVSETKKESSLLLKQLEEKNAQVERSRKNRKKEKGDRLHAMEIVKLLSDADDVTVEYGRLAVQMGKEDTSFNDGVVTAIAKVHGRAFMLVIYDYTVLAGTQGFQHHRKLDRAFVLAQQQSLPIILFPEGGGGRAGADWVGGSGLDVPTFQILSEVSTHVPVIGGISGFCFAGNAALLGCCHIVVANRLTASVAMAGPQMVIGAGLAPDVRPEALGPAVMLHRLGFLDVLVDSDQELVATVRNIAGSFAMPLIPQPSSSSLPSSCIELRSVVPSNNVRVFDPHPLLNLVFDPSSLVVTKSEFGRSVVTAFARLCGQSVAVVCSDCRFLSGALDAAATRKLARFYSIARMLQLPCICFVDTPGFLVGEAAEKEGLVSAVGELFVQGSRLPTVVSVVIRRAFGLGAMAMMGGHSKRPVAVFSWPDGQLGPMGLEGAVRLGFRKQLNEGASFEDLLQLLRSKVSALKIAEAFDVDDVIDPAETRLKIASVLSAFNKAKL